ncbi:MAG: hypothetical protein GJ680_01350 [Alteromonadaceae bacterium]|nr:hypothetical protein [Alteromonadaceae bacterium]
MRILIVVHFFVVFSVNAESVHESAKVFAQTGAANDLYGFSSVIYKDRILVGALRQKHIKTGKDTGVAFVYRLAEGQWQPETFPVPEDLQSKDGFGGKLALHEDIAAIGAIGYDRAAQDGGVVFVFQNINNQWREVTRITAPDARTGDSFGQAVAISENILIVGAPKDDDKGDDAGSVYVFTAVGESWQLQQKLTAPDGAAGDVFGISLAFSENTILIGADLNDEKANNAGAAYVYVKQGNQWQLQAKLMADDAGDTDIFGVRVAIDGDTALISARRDDDEVVGKDSGSAYVFKRKGKTWHQEAKLVGPTQQADDRFGRSVALVGDTALIGAMHKDYIGENAGAAYIFKRTGSTWSHTQTLVASDGKAGDQLGWSAALSADYAILGAVKHASKEERSGAAYVFEIEEK